MSEVIDAGWIQVGKSVPIHVHTNLDHSHELHEVCDSLPDAIGDKKDRSRRGRGQTLVGRNKVVAVLVEAPAARSDGYSRAGALVDHERAKRAETMPDGVDGDSRDPMRRHRGGDVKAEILFWVVPWPKIATGQPAAGLGPDGR